MRKMFITVLMTGFAMHLYAQIPEKKSIALVHKLTATWCPPCGGWGWQAAEELIAGSKGKGLFMSLYVGYDDNDNGLLKNHTSETLAPNFTRTNGLPNFGVNGVGRTSDYISDKNADIEGLKAACLTAVDEFSTATPPASPACAMSINGNTITVDTKVRFWSAVQGDYYIAAYLIEDSVVNMQRTPDSIRMQALHRNVLRGSISGKPFGDLIAGGAINSGVLYDMKFHFIITDPKWNKNKLKVYAVLWQKVYNDYRYVNACSSEDVPKPTSIPAVTKAPEMCLFPNPARGTTTLSVSAKEAQTIGISITDVAGHVIYQKQNYKISSGNNAITLPLSEIMPGACYVSVYTQNGSVTKHLAVLR